MLRLKPSELTLTPDDLDETLRRMSARRQQSRAPAAQGQRRTRPSGRPPPPRLVPGPQRSVRDAITHLGNIPALQPQQVIITHVDDESDESDETLADPAQRAESSPDALGFPTHPVHIASASSAAAAAAAPPARQAARLPFRLGRPRRRQDHDQESASSPKEPTDDSEGTLVEPPRLPVETTNVAGPATPSRRGQHRESTTSSSPTRQRSPSPSLVSPRGGASRSQRNRVLSTDQEALHAPSPLRQAHVISSAYSPEGDLSNLDDGRPLMRIEGHFVDQQDSPLKRVDSGASTEAAEFTNATTYTFQEAVSRAPHTEPFRRTSQPRFHSRSQSSNDAPPSRLFVPTACSPYISGEDVFWTATSSAPEHSAHDRLCGRARQHSSEMSNTSLAYSYYELSDNRQSSGEQSAQNSLSQSQHDGATASRQASRGTYRSVRLADAQSLCPSDDPASFPTLFRRAPDQQSASALLAEPYGRPSAGHLGTRFQQAIHRYVNSDSSSREVPDDAMAATIEERASPLDILEAQIERASHHIGEQHGQQYRRSHLESTHSAYRNAGPGVSSYDQYQSAHTRQRTEAPQPAPAQRQQEQLSSPIYGPPVYNVPPRHSSRHYTALSPGQGTAGRRPPRMDPRRQDQENSGEAEIEMMRQELESTRMRYDEGQQGDVMDETPPRVGRVERHM
ncbi:hypothetical protein E8E11_000319 [Didymella keratinophila]|nr:hypothetical protein E8E11_000319 [Didymella keratinophila]